MGDAREPHARFAEIYEAFNARELDWLLAQLSEDVEWPNAWEGGREVGRAAVRAYWTRQWAEIDPRLEIEEVRALGDGRVEVRVHQVVRAPDGAVLADTRVRHTYTYKDGLIARMDVASGEGGAASLDN
ncbi:MAG TPA: nuclear transport factor 2 family protein [Solirubrobacteraceae bacterium]|nr:nuclear transport factor 2 family protein [Solirubrobacteraceae bacterium]